MPISDDELFTQSFNRGKERARRLVATDAAVQFAPSAGTLIAEGDSWFSYPAFQDIVEALEKKHNYRVRSAAHFGDTAESMAYDPKQLDGVRRLFKELLDSGGDAGTPKGVLISCGGNDIVDVFRVVLNHRASGLEALNEDVVRGVLDVRLKAAIASLISSMFVFCDQYFPGKFIPIVVHGYGHAVPDGRGYPLGFAGPWLKPAFAARGHVTSDPQADSELSQNAELIATLIDRLNDQVLKELVARPELKTRVRYVDLRPIFSNTLAGNAYLDSWRDEMHATAAAFAQAADAISAALK